MSDRSFSTPFPAVGSRAVGLWLLAITALIWIMAVIGAITRLSESGLSIMEWAPIMGALPPMSEDEWQRLFTLYQTIPEYSQSLPGMDLAAFKGIFWWEYLHRLLGRVIGLAFLLPGLWFWARGAVTGRLRAHLVILFLLGGTQGALGWFMVASGFADRIDVSQYRLAAHLSLAMVIFVYALVLALSQLDHAPRNPGMEARALRPAALAVLVILALTLLAGAFVAGLNAGFIYNDFPKMGGQWIPGDYGALPWVFTNAFENPTAAQLHHRVLAALTALAVVGLTLLARRHLLGDRYRLLPFRFVALAMLLQFALGVWTLLAVVPVPLGAAHQAGAFFLLGSLTWALYRLQARVHV